MAMVQPRSARYRLWATHAALLAFVAVILFPLLMVISISFREGNFATGSLFPESPTLEHWSLALGIPYTHDDGSVTQPPFPVLLWRSEEHTSELQSLMRKSYAVFCLKKITKIYQYTVQIISNTQHSYTLY